MNARNNTPFGIVDRDGGEEEGGQVTTATTANDSPYSEFLFILTTYVIPVFENPVNSPGGEISTVGTGEGGMDTTASVTNSSSTTVENRSRASRASRASRRVAGNDDANLAHSGGAGGAAANLSRSGSIASEPLSASDGIFLSTAVLEAEAVARDTRTTARVIDLEVTDTSEIAGDTELARALLPEPEVPAPDPKMSAIPPEKVMQLLRRPATRVQRTPLQRLEILPVIAAPPPPATPSSRSSQSERNSSSKVKGGDNGKTKDGHSVESVCEEIVSGGEGKAEGGDGGQAPRAPSGALEGNPHRWVVSCQRNVGGGEGEQRRGGRGGHVRVLLALIILAVDHAFLSGRISWGGGEGHSFAACHSDSAVVTAHPSQDGPLFLLLVETPPTFWAPFTFFFRHRPHPCTHHKPYDVPTFPFLRSPQINAGESVKFAVKFSSTSPGTFDLPLTFEAVGTGRRYVLHVSGTCAFPSINSDPRNVFMRRVKHRPEGAIPPISKRFVVSRGQYEFGPLLTWKKAENRCAGHAAIFAAGLTYVTLLRPHSRFWRKKHLKFCVCDIFFAAVHGLRKRPCGRVKFIVTLFVLFCEIGTEKRGFYKP